MLIILCSSFSAKISGQHNPNSPKHTHYATVSPHTNISFCRSDRSVARYCSPPHAPPIPSQESWCLRTSTVLIHYTLSSVKTLYLRKVNPWTNRAGIPLTKSHQVLTNSALFRLIYTSLHLVISLTRSSPRTSPTEYHLLGHHRKHPLLEHHLHEYTLLEHHLEYHLRKQPLLKHHLHKYTLLEHPLGHRLLEYRLLKYHLL